MYILYKHNTHGAHWMQRCVLIGPGVMFVSCTHITSDQSTTECKATSLHIHPMTSLSHPRSAYLRLFVLLQPHQTSTHIGLRVSRLQVAGTQLSSSSLYYSSSVVFGASYHHLYSIRHHSNGQPFVSSVIIGCYKVVILNLVLLPS